MALPVQLFSLPSRLIAAGTFISPTFVVQSGFKQVTAVFTIGALDIADSTKSIIYEMDRQDPNNAANWIFDNGFTWQGNTIDPNTGLPGSPTISVETGPLDG